MTLRDDFHLFLPEPISSSLYINYRLKPIYLGVKGGSVSAIPTPVELIICIARSFIGVSKSSKSVSLIWAYTADKMLKKPILNI